MLISAEDQEIKFHHTYDSSLVMIEKCTIAFKAWIEGNGICFMSRPIVTGEKIFISINYFDSKCLKLGLTSKDPSTISLPEDSVEISSTLQSVDFRSRVAYIVLKENGSLSVCFDGSDLPQHDFKRVITDGPLWLVFEICHGRNAIQLSRSRKTFPKAYEDRSFLVDFPFET